MHVPRVATVDFESFAIKSRPEYPPKPVGVAIIKPGERKAAYWSWGHPTKNNCTFAEGRKKLREVWDYDLLFHHAKFDYDLAITHMDMKPKPWQTMHETMFLLFLHSPYARSMGLKKAAEIYLEMPPEERDAVEEWLKKNLPFEREKDHTGKYLPWGAYIAYAPGDLVGKYADGDVIRTLGLFKHLLPLITQAGMLPAYDRLRRAMPMLLRNETEGLRVDFPLLESSLVTAMDGGEVADNWLRKRLKSPSLNIDADQDWADALEKNGLVKEFNYTKPSSRHPHGVRSVSKKNLTPEMILDPQVARVYTYRNKNATAVRTFLQPWYRMASKTPQHTIHTRWNQVLSSNGNKSDGAASGRLSSSPNFQNIPKDFESGRDGFVHPDFIKGLPRLPFMRDFILPDEGCLWLHRDYSQQEMRILAHYCADWNDGLLNAYLEDPNYDVHNLVHGGLLERIGTDFARGDVKNFDFQVVYGGGKPAVAAALKCSLDTAAQCIAAVKEIVPGYDDLNEDIKERGAGGLFIKTWGGRIYYVEPATFNKDKGYMQTNEYKMLNYLIQPSAADCTFEALNNYESHPKRRGRFAVTVHDEINTNAPEKAWKEENKVLRECMLDVKNQDGEGFALPMLSAGKIGPRWGKLQKIEE